jgi:protein TonB
MTEAILSEQLVMKDLRHHAHGWALSVMLHGLAALATVTLLSELELPAQPDTCRWAVALTPKPAPVQDSAQPLERKSITQPAPAAVQRAVETKTLARPTQVTRVVQHREVMPVTESVRQVPQTVEAVQTNAQPIDEPRPIQEQVHRPGQESVRETVTHTTQSIESTQAEVVTPAVSRDAVEATHVSHPGVVHTEVEPRAPAETESMVAETPLTTDATPVTREVRAAPEVARSMTPDIVYRPAVQERRVSAVPQSQADYGWLSAALFSRIEQIKRYPALARSNHWEGRVVLEAVIRKDGTIVQAKIVESSGHAALDQDALAALERASPLGLKYPLNRSLTWHVPITSRLSHERHTYAGTANIGTLCKGVRPCGHLWGPDMSDCSRRWESSCRGSSS